MSSCVLRIKLDDANGDNSDIASHESCSDVTDGMVLDIPLEIANYADRAIVNISGVTAQSGWGTIRILGIDGNEVKVNNGTMLTVVASPYVGYTFEGWYNASTGGLVSNEAEFTFSAEFNINLLAKFEEIPYCIPTGELPIEAWFGKIKITPENSSELYYIGSTSSEVNTINSNIQNLSILGGVNIKRNTTFNLGLVKATSSTSISAMKANVWVDWNGDHEFSADEYVSSFDLNNIDNILNITVPAENTITGNTYIRLILSDTEIKNSDACEGVGTGVVYDLLVNIAPNDNERFSITATSSINGAATFTLSPAPGEDGKYPAGTNVEITCVPVSGFEFSQWLKDGMHYGATMTSNNPLPLTALYEDLNLTMKMSAMMPTYCTGTAPNIGDGYHYGISSGSLSVNDVKAFDFALSGQAIADLSQTCIADVCPGDEIQL